MKKWGLFVCLLLAGAFIRPAAGADITWNITDAASVVWGNTPSWIFLQSNGRPRIYFLNNSASRTTFNGTTWTAEALTPPASLGASDLALDGGGNPRVVYLVYNSAHSGNDLKYAAWNGAGWDIETIESTLDVFLPSIAIDAQGRPHISYSTYDEAPNPSYLKYATKDGTTWKIDPIDRAYHNYAIQENRIALDSAGHPRILYNNTSFENEGGGLGYISFDGTAWTKKVIDLKGGENLNLIIDSGDTARATYTRTASDFPGGSGYGMRYGTGSGSTWTITSLFTTGSSLSGINRLALDPSGTPGILYYENATPVNGVYGALRYATLNAGSWKNSLVTMINGSFSLAMGTGAVPHVAFYSGSRMKYATPGNGSTPPTSGGSTSPAPVAPTVSNPGKKKIITGKSTVTLKVQTSGDVTAVTYRVGKGKSQKAKGAGTWRLKVELEPGKNIVTVLAEGPGGKSKSIKITVFFE